MSLESAFEKSVAVVIGIDTYGNGIPSLTTAVNDATRLAKLLRAGHGYEVVLLTEPAIGEPILRERLQTLFTEELKTRLGHNDRLLVYFAGHGIAIDGKDGPAGYLVPQGARPGQSATLLAMTDLHSWLTDLPCRHMLAILDCCFAGAFRWAATRHMGVPPDVIYKERYERYLISDAWQVLTSAAHDQKALDVLDGGVLGRRETNDNLHSPFAQALFDALEKGEADLIPRGHGDGIITATELGLYLRERVEVEAETQASHRQTPILWPLNKHGSGEFIFLVPGHPLNLPPAPYLTPEANPYRGLESYDAKHKQFFFGREDEIKELLAKVETKPFVAVVGASGTGKSSLVKAGVVPRLQTIGNGSPHPCHVLPPLRPTHLPVGELRRHLQTAFPDYPGLAKDDDALAQLIARWSAGHPGKRLVLIVDQFEELITLCRDDAERERFLRLLACAIQQQPDAFRLIITLRTEFEPQFSRTESLLGDRWSSARYVVPPMDIDDLRHAIEGPASVRVLYFEPPELVDELISEVYLTPGALPLLSFTLSELYIRYVQSTREDRALTGDDYEKLGGVGGSLNLRATGEYNRLPRDEQATMQRVMLRMVAIEGGELARRRVARSELKYPTVQENLRVDKVLKQLEDGARLLVSGTTNGPDGVESEGYVEPAHDTLMIAWGLLLEWKTEAEEYLPLQRRLAQAATEWNKAQPADKSGLLWDDDPRLPQVEEILLATDSVQVGWWRAIRRARQVLIPKIGPLTDSRWLNKTEFEFVKQSVDARMSFWRRLIGITSLVAIVLFVITIFALFQQSEATSQRNEANHQRDSAVSAQSTAVAESNIRATAESQAQISAQAEATAAADARLKQAEAESQARRALAENLAGQSQLLIRADKQPGDLALILARDAFLTDQTLTTDRALRFALNSPHWLQSFPPPNRRHQGTVHSVAFSPNGALIVSGGEDGTVRIWRASDLEPQQLLFGHAGTVYSVGFSPDGERIVSGGDDGSVRVWNVASGAEVSSLQGDMGVVWSAEFSPDGHHIVSGSSDGTVRVWDEQKEVELARLEGHTGSVLSVAFSPTGHRIISMANGSLGSRDIRIWDALTWKEVARREIPDPLPEQGLVGSFRLARFSPSGARIVSSSSGLRVEDGETGAFLANIVESAYFTGTMAFSPDGTRIVSYREDGIVQIWDTETGARFVQLKVDENEITSLSLSPDGAYVVLSGKNGLMQVWEVPSEHQEGAIVGKQIAQMPGRHSGDVLSASFSPTGDEIVTGGADGSVRVWNVASGAEIVRIQGHEGSVNAVQFSPNGNWIISGGEDGSIRVWNVARGIEAFRMDDHLGNVLSVGFNTKGTRIISYSEGGGVQIWNADNGSELFHLEDHIGNVTSVAFSYDGQHIASVGDDRRVRVWDVASGTEVIRMEGDEASSPALSLGFSPDGSRIVSGGYEGGVIVWDVASGMMIRRLVGHTQGVSSVRFSPDGQRIVSGGGDGSVRVWDAVNGEELSRLYGHIRNVPSVEFSQDGQRIVSGGSDGSIRVWDVTNGESVAQSEIHAINMSSIGFSRDGKHIAFGGYDGSIRVWDISSGEEVARLEGHTSRVSAVGFSPDGKRLVFGGYDGSIRVWDMSSGEEMARLEGHTSRVSAVGFSPDGQYIVSVSDDQSLRVWDVERSVELNRLESHIGTVLSVGFSLNGEHILVGGKDWLNGGGYSDIRVWEISMGFDGVLETKSDVSLWKGSVLSMGVSLDGQRVVLGGQDGSIRLLDVASGVELNRLKGHTGDVFSVAFSLNGKRIVSGGEDQSVRVWDAETGMELSRLANHLGRVSLVAFSPDGALIMSHHEDGIVRLWNSPQRLLLKTTARISRPAPILTSVERTQFGISQETKLPGGDILASLRAQAQAQQLVEQGREEARLGAVAGAVALFEQAMKLDPALTFEPQTQAESALGDRVKALLLIGRDLARSGNMAEAIATFEEVASLNPNLDMKPEIEAKRLFAAVVVDVGRQLALQGSISGAIAKFEEALSLDPDLRIEPEEEAKRLFAPRIADEARILAESGDLEGAIAKFKEALSFEPKLDIEPEPEARRLFAPRIADEARILAESGDLEGAIAKFKEALSFDPKLDIEPEPEARRLFAPTIASEGSRLAEYGDIAGAFAKFEEASILDPSLSSNTKTAWAWRNLCWFGSLYGYAAQVLDDCEIAVALNPHDGYARESRGLARALTGDVQGAIEDFEFAGRELFDDRIGMRLAWIIALRAGTDPKLIFDTETLDKFKPKG